LVVDKLTYAGGLESLRSVSNNERFQFLQADICEADTMRAALCNFRPQIVTHLAAETHVDRSIDNPAAFLESNVQGTFTLLQAALTYWRELQGPARESFRFHHISTDEVYGSLGSSGKFLEESPYRPNSPYSASKAASDHLVCAWHHTYGLPVLLSRSSNNYGPFQFPEKLMPTVIIRALSDETIPIYGVGANVRDWIYVEDHAAALLQIANKGKPGSSYNVGAYCERTNRNVVREICRALDEFAPHPTLPSYERLVEFVTDRPGHDYRYAIDATHIHDEIGWQPVESFQSGIRKTVRWYLDNRPWWEQIRSKTYAGERLGLKQWTG
jgi:dTDP-glucose 4,6-dehydratase